MAHHKKHVPTGRYGVLYRRENGRFIVVEPETVYDDQDYALFAMAPDEESARETAMELGGRRCNSLGIGTRYAGPVPQSPFPEGVEIIRD